ncbi:PAS domain S-box protein [uncultured Sulfitobacter sp.]|uniref:PAS domain S-box protein n=1 Tax=uncultured Sulfitobacter sp. TaxID=191468 RepID=UPI0026172D1F|nr:PAS domain S-box protein [uncultured Sulfitobacter sp.]
MKHINEAMLLRALLDASVDAIVVADSEGIILRLNKAAATLFGYSVEDLTGKNVKLLMPAGVAAYHDDYLQHHLKTGETRLIGTGREDTGVRADGTPFPMHLSVGRADLDGDVAFVAILHDLTRRRAAEMAAERSQRIDAIGQMTGGIAHDFNNLLAVIVGNLELLEMAERDGSNKALIHDALEAAEMGADLTSRLLVFARKSDLKAEVLVINSAVSQSLAMLRRAVGPLTVIEESLAADLWQAQIDQTQLQTAVLNLVLNARDAMPKGGRIFIETTNMTLDDDYLAQEIGVEPGRYVRLSISDSGEGMSADTQKKALEPFFTTKPVGKGTGLGLSTVYGFVKQSAGHLTIYSEPGQGTSIKLYFPAVFSEVEQDADALSVPEALAGTRNGRLVLLVEDDPRVMRTSQARLAALGLDCITAQSGDAAWEILQERDDIWLVFSDLIMPGTMSGHDLAKRLAQEMPHIRVLLTSGFSEGVLRDGRVEAEFAILRKPFRQADLAAALRALIASR